MSTIIGVFKDRFKAESVINEIKAAGVADTDISCIYKDGEGDAKDSQTGEKVGSGAVAGATTGTVIGAIAGLAVANGILPGLGTLFVAGPLAAALGLTGAAATTVAGAATGAAAGGLIGALSQLGISAKDAELYEEHIKKGETVVIVKTDDAAASVEEMFNNGEAHEVRNYAM